MDEKLEQALDISNLMITMNNQKRLLKEKYKENIIHYFNGGQFTVTQQIISFCQSLLSLGQTDTILIDDNDTPVKIEDLQLFADELVNVYWKSANSYLVEYNNLKANRSVKGIIDL